MTPCEGGSTSRLLRRRNEQPLRHSSCNQDELAAINAPRTTKRARRARNVIAPNRRCIPRATVIGGAFARAVGAVLSICAHGADQVRKEGRRRA